jgi:Cytosolic carboxypeptidase N-terminal domain
MFCGSTTFDSGSMSGVVCTGNIQWFYFSVRGASPGMTVRFNLVNHNKDDSLFNYGLLPAVYSQLDCERHQFGWRRLGTNACYYRSSAPRPQRKKKKPPSPRKYYFVATFTYTFPHAGDTVYFAYCQPYSASKLQAFLQVCGPYVSCVLLSAKPLVNTPGIRVGPTVECVLSEANVV